MNVALLLSGGVRNVEDTFKSIEYHILNKFKNVDVFIYGLENKLGYQQNYDLLNNLFSPKKIILNNSKFYTENNLNKNINSNSIYALFNVKKVNELKNEYKKESGKSYDLIIRSRMDHFWIRSINDFEVEKSINNILIPYDWSFKNINNISLSDLYCITNDFQVEHYANAYDNIDLYTSNYHPETYIGHHLKNQNVTQIARHINTEYPLIGPWSEPLYNSFNTFDENGNQIYPIKNTYGNIENDLFFSPKVWKYPTDFPNFNGNPVDLRKRFD